MHLQVLLTYIPTGWYTIVMGRPNKNSSKKPAKDKLLEAAVSLIRQNGYTSTTVDDLCRAAGVTKGTFFHYFESKEALAVAAAQYWSQMTGELFKSAPYHQLPDPLQRVLAYIDLRKEFLKGETAEFTCLVGTMVQEIYSSHPEIKEACENSIFGHAETLVADIEAAKKLYTPKAKWTSKGLALHTQAVLQGAFILAKASGDVTVAIESVEHLKNYIQILFQNHNSTKTKKES